MSDQVFKKVSRRLFLAGTAGAVANAAVGGPAVLAQATWPTRPIRIIVGFGPGGLADITMRILGEKLSARLGQPVVIENRPGAGGTLAAQAALAAVPDGYTMVVLSVGTAISVSFLRSVPYDPVKDFVPISTVAFYDLLLLVAANSPFKTLADFLAEARRLGDALNIGTITAGTSQNVAGELFKTAAGIKTTIIPYRNTGDVQIALLRGDIALGVESYTALKGPIDDGALRALASTGPSRTLANVPTARESGLPSYEMEGWNALFARAGTPPAVVERLNKEINAVLEMPDVKQRILDLGTEPRASTAEAAGKLLRDDIVKWGEVIEHAGLKRQG
jgi:tripartite-type tricarboxylate transporter receptor subunit TctC